MKKPSIITLYPLSEVPFIDENDFIRFRSTVTLNDTKNNI